jgi:hypothetical protein
VEVQRRQFFRGMRYLLLLSPCSVNDLSASSSTSEAPKTKKAKRSSAKSDSSHGGGSALVQDITGRAAAVMFERFEDEMFMQAAKAALLLPSSAHMNKSGSRMTALFLSLEGWQAALQDIEKVVPDT